MPRKAKPAITEPVNPSRPSIDEHRKYEARDALLTLTRADEIRRDKALMRDVKKEAKAQIKTASRVLTGERKKRGEA